jgi:hypothetical protein
MKKSKNRPKLRKKSKKWTPSADDIINKFWWLDATSELSVVTIDNKVSMWLDKSGNENHLQSKNTKGIKHEKD